VGAKTTKRRRAPQARGVPSRRRVLCVGLRGVPGRAPEDHRRPETRVDSAVLIDFFVHLLEMRDRIPEGDGGPCVCYFA
jgi:hypothetical protein